MNGITGEKVDQTIIGISKKIDTCLKDESTDVTEMTKALAWLISARAFAAQAERQSFKPWILSYTRWQ